MGSTRPDADAERQWIRQAQRGDREAFGLLVETHRRRVFSLVFHLVRRKDEIEDLVQEIFLKAFLAIRGYNFQSAFSTWLNRIAINHCYDYLRRERASRISYVGQMSAEAQRQIEETVSAEGSQGLNPEQQALVRNLAAALLERAPADDGVILVLKEMEDFSVEEIAELLRLREGTVKVRLHRARKRMLEDLKRLREGR
jgi:RNA polymerase sigma-70 factor (ECF subfamily)